MTSQMSRLSRFLLVLLAGFVVSVQPAEAISLPRPPGRLPSVAAATTPAFDDDAPDPAVVRFGSSYYAYTTGTSWGNRIGVLVSDRPDGGFHTCLLYTSDAADE